MNSLNDYHGYMESLNTKPIQLVLTFFPSAYIVNQNLTSYIIIESQKPTLELTEVN